MPPPGEIFLLCLAARSAESLTIEQALADGESSTDE
jgi:hypothetical protein